MIYRDERGHRWLRCDSCPVDCAAEFFGIGLESAKLVRQCATDLEGWKRQKIIVCFEPLRARYVDLCRGCQQPEVAAMRLLGAAITDGR